MRWEWTRFTKIKEYYQEESGAEVNSILATLNCQAEKERVRRNHFDI